MTTNELLDSIAEQIRVHSIHTVEVGVADTYGHLRGKRVPAKRFLDTVAVDGINIADAIYVFDVQCEIVDSPIINMGTGYLDMHLVCDLSSFRVLSHRQGYALVLCDAFDEHNQPHPLDPRSVLRQQLTRVADLGYEPYVATELECYLFQSDWKPLQTHVQYSSLTDALGLETVVFEIRSALEGAGITVESSNPEYGPGQLEINFGPSDALRTADNTVIFKSIVKQVAALHGLHASFMPKPHSGQSGSGMHVHTSLRRDGVNQFERSPEGGPNQIMAEWTAGIVHNAKAMQLVGIPTINGYRRVRSNTFCPTHVHWGEDNRTVMARLTINAGAGQGANRVEYRSAGADANPYLIIAAVLAAGVDGIVMGRPLPPIATGDMYASPGQSEPLPTSLPSAISLFRNSPLAAAFGHHFSENFVVLAENEVAVSVGTMSADADEVNDWEFRRYREHT